MQDSPKKNIKQKVIKEFNTIGSEHTNEDEITVETNNIIVHKQPNGIWQAAYIDAGFMVPENQLISPGGTPGYAADELLSAADNDQQIQATKAMDIYALGKTLKDLWRQEIDQKQTLSDFTHFLETLTHSDPKKRPTAAAALTTLDPEQKTNQRMQVATGLLIAGVAAAVGVGIALSVLTMGTSLLAVLVITGIVIAGGFAAGGIYQGLRSPSFFPRVASKLDFLKPSLTISPK